MSATSEILAMTAAEKAKLFADGARQITEGRHVAALALASLERSNGYLELGFKSVEDLAKEKGNGKLGVWDVTDLLRVGRKLLDLPRLNEALRAGLLSWSHVRALVPLIQEKNAAEWIGKSIGKTSNEVERMVSNKRHPAVSGPTRPVHLSLRNYRRFEELARGVRAEAGKKYLSDEECWMRLLDELEAGRETRASAASATTSTPMSVPPAAPSAPSAAADGVVPVDPCAPASRHIPAAIRRKVMNRARHACEICRNRHGLEVHHANVPFSKGGPHSLENLVVVCHQCHVQLHRNKRQDAPPPPAAECERGACDPGHEGCLARRESKAHMPIPQGIPEDQRSTAEALPGTPSFTTATGSSWLRPCFERATITNPQRTRALAPGAPSLSAAVAPAPSEASLDRR